MGRLSDITEFIDHRSGWCARTLINVLWPFIMLACRALRPEEQQQQPDHWLSCSAEILVEEQVSSESSCIMVGHS
jgi:hypothetical protein